MILAILVCKLLRFVGKLVGKGSSLPGQYALKLCPDVLGRVELPPYIIAVTGSNGKTSTVEMIAAILKDSGKEVLYNAEGSNQIEGVTTLILTHATLGGKVKGDVLLLESDERYARLTFRYFHPTHFVITNLYRDQLTRNGHPEWVYDAILPAIHPETTLVLNADDPLVSCFAQNHEKVKWFGLEECSIDTTTPQGAYDDSYRCPVCKGKMTYSRYHYHHIGFYQCPACGHHRHEPDFAVTALDLDAGRLTLDGDTEITLAFRSIYNVYNILAAWSVCRLAGVEKANAARVINGYILKNGRMVTFKLGGHHGTLLTSKHENSVAYDTNLGYIRQSGQDCTVLVIVDAISRKYFTGETSWLWDIDFDQLNCENVKRVVLCGKYVNDLALRFDFTKVPGEKIVCFDTVPQAAEALRASGDEEVFVVTCFSDRDKLLNLVEREA
jgi:UDP-N-acetylmuramyl tripeptide synthase